MNLNYITDFHKSRENRIGASDISWCTPHPEVQIESLAAYTDQKGKRHHNTANDLYLEKINGKDWEYSFPADMGHYLEGKALREFIADNIDHDIAFEFFRGYQLHKLETELQSKKSGYSVCVNPEPYNNTTFKHNTEAITDYGVAHSDCVYVPTDILQGGFFANGDTTKKISSIIKKNGLTIDLSKPFGIEAKSARRYTVDARKRDKYKGYDLTLKTWQGIPLSNYFQIQYQMALYKYDVTYLSLIFDTSEKHYWTIKANKKHQRELIQIAKYMKQCIDSKTPPKKLIMNSKDIAKLFPKIKEDFREVKDEELKEILEIATIQRESAEQEKLHKKKKEDANQRMSIHLKDSGMIKGIVNGKLQTITKWKYTGGGLYTQSLSDIKEREDSKKLLRYFEKNDLIKEQTKNKNPSVAISLKELEVVEYETNN